MRSEGQRTSALKPEQVEADDLAMQAYAIWFRGLSRENVLQAWQLLEAAVARDPESIRAWNGIALMAARAAQEHWVPDVNAARARQAEALRALERLDPDHVLTLMARNRTYWQRGDFEGLLRLSHAITERMPSHPFGYTQRAWAHINLGQFEECPAPLRKAIQLGPRDTEVPLTRMTLSLCYWLLGRFGEAVEAARLAEQTNAGLRALPLLLVAVLASDGRVDEARRIVGEHKGKPDFRVDGRASLLLGKHPRVVEGRERFAATLREMGVP